MFSNPISRSSMNSEEGASPANGGMRLATEHGLASSGERARRDHALQSMLILEDFDSIRAYLAHHFERLGFRVYSAARIGDAIAICQSMLPRVIIIDHDLIGEQWQDAVQEMRANLPGSTIIVMGGVASDGLRTEARGLGASQLFPGGYDLEKLDGIIQNA